MNIPLCLQLTPSPKKNTGTEEDGDGNGSPHSPTPPGTPTTSRRGPKDTKRKQKTSGKAPAAAATEAGDVVAYDPTMPAALVGLLRTSLEDSRPPAVTTPETAFAGYVGQMAASLHPSLRIQFETQVRHISHTCNHKEYN
jgi:hypothetical protein